MSEQVPAEIDKLLVVYNEHSSHAQTEGKAYLNRMYEIYGSRVHEIRTDLNPEVTGRKIQDSLNRNESTRVLSLGGDSTDGAAALALANKEVVDRFGPVGLHVAPVGGANDIYYSIANKHAPYDPIASLRQTWAFGVHPVRAKVTPPNESVTRLYRAAAHLSIGDGSANTADYLNHPTMRALKQNKHLHDIRATLHLLLHSKRFVTIDTDDRRHILLDDIYPVVTRMGKNVTFPGVGLEDTELHRYMVHGIQPKVIALGGVLLHIMKHETPPDGQTAYTLGKYPRTGVWIQHDGEARRVPARSEITVRREPVPYYLMRA